MDEDRDHLLMRRLTRDDEAAMAELVQYWQRPLLSFISRFLGGADEEARDLAQEAFLRVWRQRRTWRPDAAFSTWLFTIAGNLCRNRRRDLARRPALVPVWSDEDAEGMPGPLSPAEADPAALAQAGETASILRVALARLPDAQRAALLLRRVEGMSYREIGEVLGVTPAAVDSLLVRARRALTSALAQDFSTGGVEQRGGSTDELH